MATGYLMSIYIGRIGGVSHVGFYNSGVSIINTYMTMIFGAMATDYYPRLSGLANDNVKARELINQQAELAILIIAPLLIVFIIFIKPIILMMYTAKFLVILDMVQFFALGIFFKAITWSMGFMMLAKGDAKLFFISELAANIYVLLINMFFYKVYGLTGLGISFILSYVLGLLQTYAIIKIKYKFSFNKELVQLFVLLFILAVISFLVMHFVNVSARYWIAIAIMIFTIVFSIKVLNNRIQIADLIRNKYNITLPWLKKP